MRFVGRLSCLSYPPRVCKAKAVHDRGTARGSRTNSSLVENDGFVMAKTSTCSVCPVPAVSPRALDLDRDGPLLSSGVQRKSMVLLPLFTE
jgi:hypothetical protein